MGKKALILGIVVIVPLLFFLSQRNISKPASSMGYVYHGSSMEKVVALTFDDGPHEKYTPQILKLLEKYNAKATFFVLGQKVVEYPEIIEEMDKEGQEIGNHSYSHIDIKNTSRSELLKQIEYTQQAVFWVTGKTPRLFRPPYGRKSDKVIEVAQQEGCQVILWTHDKDSRDWSLPGVYRIVHSIVSNVKNGDIILMHDSVEGSSQTIEALKQILPELQRKGYRFVTVSELIKSYENLPPKE